MRHLFSVLFVLSLAGCSLWLPRPDPKQAWIDLHPHGETELRAVAVDEKPLKDQRYFQVTPGRHELGMRYSFEVTGNNMGREQPLQRNCRLSLQYAGFDAGARYRLEAGRHGFRPWAKLLDEQNRLLARGEEKGCAGA